MPRRPEIGNVQLYPDRPLRRSDRNGYVLKFYCPILRKRIRRNCGTRDRREARKLQRECQERLLNGEYLTSDGAISASHVVQKPIQAETAKPSDGESSGPTWQECYDRYLDHRRLRVRTDSLVEIVSRLGIAERILEAQLRDAGRSEGLLMSDVATLDRLEYLQERLLAGDECRYDTRSPHTVNSVLRAVMAFMRFCKGRGWVTEVPSLQKVEFNEVMKGRPITEEEFQKMLDAAEFVVGEDSAASWIFAMKVLWESGFRAGDLMDFSWDNPRHIHPIWPTQAERLPTIAIPSSQKNGRVQEMPMLPGLEELLRKIPEQQRTGWVVNPKAIEFDFHGGVESFRPCASDLRSLATRCSNSMIARVCVVTEAAVRKWMKQLKILGNRPSQNCSSLSDLQVARLRANAERKPTDKLRHETVRMSKERVGRIVGLIGKKADVVVQVEDARTHHRVKYASAHDIRRGLAQRLINIGVSAETLKVVMRHKDFATTEKHYGAVRSAQSAGAEIIARLRPAADNSAFVGGLVGGVNKAQQLSAEELLVLKSLLARL
jgi:integrase